MTGFMKGDIYIDKDYKNYIHENEGSNQTVFGGKKNETFLIAAADNTLCAGAGDDKISLVAFSWNDVVYGEAGNDFIGTCLNTKNPTIYGGTGNDTIRVNGSVKAYADGGAGDDLFVPLENAKVTLTGGEGNDTFWLIESATAKISGGSGKNLYFFDPYYLFGPYHNDVIITDISSNDTIRYNEENSDTTELSWSKDSAGNIVLTDEGFRNFNITLQGVTELSQVAGVTYRSVNETKTLGEIFNVTENKWEYENSTATYKVNGQVVLTVDGVKSLNGLKLNGKVVTVSKSAIGTENISINGTGYKLALGTDVTTPKTTSGSWKLNGTTATYESGGTTEGYELSDDGKSISFVAAGEGDTLITVDGVKSLNGLKLNGKVVTVSKSAVGTENISINGTGYKLALGADVSTPKTTGGSWKLNGTTATYESSGTSEGYELSDDGKSINFVEGVKSEDDVPITISGMKSAKGLSFNGETVKINPKNINSKTKFATVSGENYTFELTGSGKLFAGENTVLKGSSKNDTLIANVAATLDGGKGKDLYVYNGGNVTVEYSAGDKVSLGAGFEIVGVAAEDNGISLTLSKDGNSDEKYSLMLSGATSKTKVNLVTTKVVKGKNKATSSAVYFSDDKIADNTTAAKTKKVTILSGEADFSEVNGAGQKAKSVYAALTNIVAAGENAIVYGNNKANTIVISNGATDVRGGIGNDTFSIAGGDVTITDFGIGATTPLQGGDLVKLPAKVTAVQGTGKKESILGYSEDTYAPGTDTIKINGKIIGATVTDGDDKSETFSVELSVTYSDGSEGTVALENIQRDFKKNSAKNIKNGGDEFIPKNGTLAKDLAKLKIFDTSTGKSKAVKWNKLPVFNADMADLDTANYLMSDDNFSADAASCDELGEIMTTPTSNALTGEIFTDDPTIIAPLQVTFADPTKK